MVATFDRNSTNFTWKLHLLLIYVCAFTLNRENQILTLGPVSDTGTIHLNKLNELQHDPKNARQYLSDRIGKSRTLCFELCPNFTFNSELFNDILNINNAMVIIRFNDELKKLVKRNMVKSSEYINKFLTNLIHMHNLQKLDLSSLNLTEIPRIINEFKNIEILDLGYNEIDSLEFDWNCLRNLKYLYLGLGEKITNLDESIFNLSSLTTFRISNCSIKEIPEDINKLKNLEDLNISGGSLKKFPRNLISLKKLTILDIWYCGFEELFINLHHHPDLESLLLRSNHSLKYLKLVILDIPQKLNYFVVTECPLEEVEILLSLKNTKFDAFNRNNQQLEDVDYAIKLCAEELFGLPKNQVSTNSKIYEFNISTGPGFLKTVSIRNFDTEKIKALSGLRLIDKWLGICKDFNLESDADLHDEYIHSIEFIKSLFENGSGDCSDWTTSFPFEYKEKVALILFELFDKLENESLESHTRSILKIFKRPVSEQLIFFNYLLKYSKPCSREKNCFVAFVRESIEISKNFAFTTCLNLEKCERAASLRRLVKDRDGRQIVLRETDKSEVYKELLMAIIDAKKNFDFKFTVEYFSEIIGNVIARIDDPELFNYEKMVESLLENGKIRPEFFENEKQNNADIIKKPSSQGMKVLISLIVTGQMPIPNE